MTDRELLEKAAKAAGLPHKWIPLLGKMVHIIDAGLLEEWNPLTDDGDEARLEAVLCMHVEWHPGAGTVYVGTAEIGCTLPLGDDRQAARRRAGVRAAAAIGEQQ